MTGQTIFLTIGAVLLALAMAAVARDMILIVTWADVLGHLKRRLLIGGFVFAGLIGLEVAFIQTLVERF